jgi:hypothetical protein
VQTSASYSSLLQDMRTWGYALIIRLNRLENSALLFDQLHGKVSVRMGKHARFVQGAYIATYQDAASPRLQMSERDMLLLPASWVMEDLLFLHAVLELVDLLSAWQQPDEQLFTHLQRLYADWLSPFSPEPKAQQLLFLCHLLYLGGLYVPQPALVRAASSCFFQDTQTSMSVLCEKELWESARIWFVATVAHHPRAAQMKTIERLMNTWWGG